jgi:hypothetical protein
MKYDFSGYATKNDLECSDGRTIRKDAFKENDGKIVPLVWQHLHNDPVNILGHAVLENRADGVYAYCTFNDTEAAKNTKKLVVHGDITALSIYANQLAQQGKNVIHGMIREVSLVLTGANPGASIDNLSFAHADGSDTIAEDEALIYTDLGISLPDNPANTLKMEDQKKPPEKEKTVQDVVNSMNEEQKAVLYTLVAEALATKEETDEEMSASDTNTDKVEHSTNEGETTMKPNVFEKPDAAGKANTLSHADFKKITDDAVNFGGSVAKSFLAHAGEYGITNIDYLFPDAQALTSAPHLITRDMGWVSVVLNETKHTPFSRIKSLAADITADEARAKGYVKGNTKIEEVFSLLRRITGPQTIYKKQKLDRDDILDITDFDVVSFLKAEMRLLLDEEAARAIMVGDGRSALSDDKIKQENVRSIYADDVLYAHHVEIDGGTILVPTPLEDVMDSMILAREFYKGSGTPSFFTTTQMLSKLLLLRDKMGRRLYSTKTDLAAALMCKDIVEVPPMSSVTRTTGVAPDEKVLTLLGIMVNLKDYSVGADKGGAINMFDDFDIDVNQYKYLIETRISGALTIPKSALDFEQTAPHA